MSDFPKADCSHFIGMPYCLGSDGSNGKIDCIHLVFKVLDALNISTPLFNNGWYESQWMEVARDLLTWGFRIKRPSQDGDVLLLPEQNYAFAVTWHSGILYINRNLGAVAWIPLDFIPTVHAFRCRSFLTSGN